MAIQVPVDVDVTGLGPLDVLDKKLDDIADPRSGTVGLDTSPAVAAAAALDKLLDEATETREADVKVDVDGLNNLDKLRESLDMTKERAEVAALEKALDAVAKLRTANVDVEGTKEGQAKLAALDKALKAVERRRTVEVDVDVDSDAMGRVVRQAAQSAEGVQSAFSSAFQLIARNAVILGVAVAAAFAVLPAAGALAASGIVLAFGAGIAGVGILAAAQSEKVKAAFGGMADHIVKEMKRISAPLEGTLISISDQITRTFDNMTPTFEKAFADMAPALTKFSDQFFKAFEGLEPAVAPLTAAFTDLLDAIGPKLEGFFTNISDAVIGLSETISADPELFASLFVGFLNIIPAILNGINGLAQAFVFVYELISTELKPAFDDFKTAIEPLTDLFSKATGGASIFQVIMGAVGFILTQTVQTIANVIQTITLLINGFRTAGTTIANIWNRVRAVTVAVWNRVKSAVSTAVNAVRAAVANAMARVIRVWAQVWNQIRAVTSRVVAAVRGAVSSGLNAVRGVVSSVMNRIRSVFSSVWSAIRGVVSSGISRVRSVISRGLSAAIGIARSAWSRIRSAFSSGVSNAVGVVRAMPGRIIGILSGLGGRLFSSGWSMISSFASGIRAGIGNAVSAASSAVGAVRRLFPFSPAKEGPFSGSGYTDKSGEALMEDWAKAIQATAGRVTPGIAAALDPAANAFSNPLRSGSVVGGSSAASEAASPGPGGDLVQALGALFAALKIEVNLGLDRRTTATFWLEGQRLAEVLQ